MDKNPETLLFKTLGNAERFAILKRLMAEQATLSQLGKVFKKTPAHIRHHLKLLEEAGLVEFAEARTVQGGPEKYYRATQRALIIHQVILPEAPRGKFRVIIGSMDAGIAQLAGYLTQKHIPVSIVTIPLSSLDGLLAVRQGLCQMSTSHLIDSQSGEYNSPFIRHLFPGQAMALFKLYWREEGLMVKAGNPLGLRSLEDLVQPRVVFVNREAGSGVRQWLDLRLSQSGIAPETIHGYGRVVNSHTEVARAVQTGEADTGIGIAASAREFGLDFIPLFQEPYEFVMPRDLATDIRYAPLFDALNSGEFRTILQRLEGYTVLQNSGGVEHVGP